MMNTTQTQTQTLTATWTRLRDGSFGLRVTSEDVRAGETVTATRRDGSTSREVVGRVLWTGDGVALCTVGQPTVRAATRRPYYRSGSGRGSAAPVRGYSSYCTDRDGCGCYDCAS